MLRQFYCSDGSVYARSTNMWVPLTVDEVIEFLEKHRGKTFWNGGAGENSFRADGRCVLCGEFDFWMSDIYNNNSYSQFIEEWFNGEEINGDDSEFIKALNTSDPDVIFEAIYPPGLVALRRLEKEVK